MFSATAQGNVQRNKLSLHAQVDEVVMGHVTFYKFLPLALGLES